MKEVDAVEEGFVAIHISPTTPVMVLISKKFLGISAVPISMIFKEMEKRILAVKASVQSLVTDTVTMVHAGTWAWWRTTDFRN